jgi:hypothetical protein
VLLLIFLLIYALPREMAGSHMPDRIRNADALHCQPDHGDLEQRKSAGQRQEQRGSAYSADRHPYF